MNILFPISIVLIHFSYRITATSIRDTQGTNADRIALLAIKSQISRDPQSIFGSWNDSRHICEWQGVTCGSRHRERVVSITLDSEGLVGTLSPFVGNLSFLRYLNLFNNTFQGHIPYEIGHLSRLKILDLQINSFEGQVPANISRCLNLEVLGLSRNNLSGTIPPELGLLSSMKQLSISENRFTGNLLNVLMNMSSLEFLQAAFNSFDGIIPDSIGQLRNLMVLAIGPNDFTGTIPQALYNLSSLQVISLGNNRLEGSLPQDIGFHLPRLTVFEIQVNFFHGHVPASFSNLTQLQELNIYSNNFTGSFSFSAKNMPNFQRLFIDINYLGTGGEVDDLRFLQTLTNCSQLQYLECSSNNFGGILPHFLGNMTRLQGIGFSINQITGSIPSGLFSLTNLERVGLFDNHLSGSLPPEIGKLAKLEALSVEGNSLTGNIPYSLGNLSQLSELYLDNNNFEGAIPPSLGDCTNLLHLDLSQNNLTGTLPPHLFRASMLVDLYLDQNHLQGALPVEIGAVKNLMSLNIAGNDFNGEIPSNLGGCIGLVELYMGGNFFTGPIPQSFKSLTSIKYLDLSHNRLSGQIPNFLSNFPLLSLNLSFNDFEGEVPSKGGFSNLSALSVSANPKLCGGVVGLHLPRCPSGSSAKESKRRLSLAVTLIIATACLVTGVSIVTLIYMICSRRKGNELTQKSSVTELLMKVSFAMLLKATNGFSEANLLGRGSFGSVYKAVLDPESTVVAVKVMNLEHQGAHKSFMAECKTLRSIRHRNLLKIITACSSTDYQGKDFKALVYEFMSNGSLHEWIHENQAADGHQQALSLLQRLNIAIDVACALDYLHNSCEVPIIHCDLKPSNVLLDNEMVAHVGDFGLTKFHSHHGTSNNSSLAVKGTVGYAAPEYGLGSVASREGDVYSFGIMLMEMMTAKKPTDRAFEGGLNLHYYARSALPDQLTKIIDPRLLHDNIGNELVGNGRDIECIKCIIEIGVKCSAESLQERLSIKDAILELQSARGIFSRRR